MAYSKTIDEIKELIKMEEPYFLFEAKMIGKEQSYICPCCGSGSGEKGTGITKIPHKESYHCFGCGRTMDIFALIMEDQGIKDFMDAFRWACNFYGIDYEAEEERNHMQYTVKYKPKYKPYTDGASCQDYCEWAASNENYDYLLSRGISVETQKRFGIGYDPEWRHPKVPEYVPCTPRCIIPTSQTSYLARDVRPDDEMDAIGKKYCKSKVGQVHIFNMDVVEELPEYLFVCEGEIDALSIEECGYPAIGLGSAANVDRFLDEMDERYRCVPHIFIIPDHDEKGKKATEKLAQELEKRGSCEKAHIVEFPKNAHYKDPNEFLVANRNWFEAFLRAVVEGTYLTERINVDVETYEYLKKLAMMRNCSVAEYLQDLAYLQYKKETEENSMEESNYEVGRV